MLRFIVLKVSKVMEPDVKQVENTIGVETPGMNLEEPGILSKLPALDDAGDQWKTVLDNVYKVLAGLPDYLTTFFGEYRKPLVTLGLIFGSVVSVKLTLALLDAVNDIPLLAPTFELIGLGYTAWFVYRYMLKATNREELSKEFSQLKDQVVGKVSKL
jgi:CAAD domains of cyanobacterial aminoacyl-tRNA synthetase